MFRSLHEADPFGLFSEPPCDDEEEKGDCEEDVSPVGGSNGQGGEASVTTTAVVLPDNVEHMLSMMKIIRVDKVCKSLCGE